MLQEVAEATGVPPAALRDRPDLEGHLQVKYVVFLEVEAGRRYSNGYPLQLGPADLMAYKLLHNISDAEMPAVIEAVRLFDKVWLDLKIAEREAKKTPMSSGSS